MLFCPFHQVEKADFELQQPTPLQACWVSSLEDTGVAFVALRLEEDPLMYNTELFKSLKSNLGVLVVVVHLLLAVFQQLEYLQ